jgi:formiminotetrahydrofolate cyclodeaminase
VNELGKKSLESFLDAVAEASPAPGGGTSAAVAVALAAGLVEMTARLGAGADAAGQARSLRARALELAEEELTSYAPVLAAETAPERSAALVAASEPPARIAETAADVAELGLTVAMSSSPAVRGDALTAVTLSEAAAAAAERLVWINLGSSSAHERAHAAARKAAAARLAIPR